LSDQPDVAGMMFSSTFQIDLLAPQTGATQEITLAPNSIKGPRRPNNRAKNNCAGFENNFFFNRSAVNRALTICLAKQPLNVSVVGFSKSDD
jgi:hypothetical protein